MKVVIELNEYCHTCGDGCCTDYGTQVVVNGVEMPAHNQDAKTILRQVMEHLGYEVEIIENYETD
jgi:hypothetical protein